MRTFIKKIQHGSEINLPELEEGEVMIFIGSPDRSVVPWDTRAREIRRSACLAFNRGKVEAEVMICNRRALGARGTGPGGSRRFGDDHMPPEVWAIVRKQDAGRAEAVWENFTGRQYLKKPFYVHGDLHQDKRGAWCRGGAWPKVVVNAIFLAGKIGASEDRIARLKAYAGRKYPKAEERGKHYAFYYPNGKGKSPHLRTPQIYSFDSEEERDEACASYGPSSNGVNGPFLEKADSSDARVISAREGEEAFGVWFSGVREWRQ
jgi:hypothetical protein